MGLLDRFRGRVRQAAAASDVSATDRQMAEALDAANAGNYDSALSLWEPLARAGVARAQNNIGACFAEGLGVEPDRALAKQWLKLAAEAGDPVGERNYAAFHMQKQDATAADYALAADFYRRAAEKGDAPAQDMLSWLLLEGEIIAADPAEARIWAERAAEAGVATSMTRLGMLYHNAVGVERDPEKAAHWWQLGAEKGDADAQAMLGAALHMGSGLARDGVAALSWLIRAMHGGSALAGPFIGPAKAALSSAEIAEAEQRAATMPASGYVS